MGSQLRFGPREGYVPVGNASLYYRETGVGEPLVILHGGPDFDHGYLLPDMDRLADSFRLIYYDQRGRGKSAEGVRPEDVTMESEVEDLDRLREYFKLEAAALLGHSWGGVVAMEYAIRHPDRVSRLVLMNSAPASRDDFLLFRQDRSEKMPEDVVKLKELVSTDGYKEGDPDAVADYYRVHYRGALKRPEHVEQVVTSLRSRFTPESILRSWAIEDRLMNETWLSTEYNLLPRLKPLTIPTLVIHGDSDMVPLECSAHIAQAMPKSRLVVLKECGHFAYLERPDELHEVMTEVASVAGSARRETRNVKRDRRRPPNDANHET